MGDSTASATSTIEVVGIRVDCQDHITRTVGDAVIWVWGNIVEELVESISGGLGSRGLLGANGADSDKKFIFNRASVPKESTKNTLDMFNTAHVECRARIRCSSFLGLGVVGDGGMLVRGYLGLGGSWMVVAGEGFLVVGGHVHATRVFVVVPVKVHTGKFGTLPVISDVVVLLEDVADVKGVAFADVFNAEVIDN